GCTFAGAQPQAAARADCGEVLTTLACTLVKPAGAEADNTMCATLFTLTPTWCSPTTGNSANDCKHVMWTAGCTFAGAQGATANRADCGEVLT
ncbi:hypothetical protein ACQ1Y8_14270, partial [Enterococcus faecalis]